MPCAVPWFTEMGFITLAYMALSGFLLIGTLLVTEWIWDRRVDAAGDPEDSLSPDYAEGGPTGNHVPAPADQMGAADEPGDAPALEVAGGSGGAWTDAGVSWGAPRRLIVDYTESGRNASINLDLGDPRWTVLLP